MCLMCVAPVLVAVCVCVCVCVCVMRVARVVMCTLMVAITMR